MTSSDADEARRIFGETRGLRIRRTRLDDPRDLTDALQEAHTSGFAVSAFTTAAAGVVPTIQGGPYDDHWNHRRERDPR
jgi:hypothetical protein